VLRDNTKKMEGHKKIKKTTPVPASETAPDVLIGKDALNGVRKNTGNDLYGLDILNRIQLDELSSESVYKMDEVDRVWGQFRHAVDLLNQSIDNYKMSYNSQCLLTSDSRTRSFTLQEAREIGCMSSDSERQCETKFQTWCVNTKLNNEKNQVVRAFRDMDDKRRAVSAAQNTLVDVNDLIAIIHGGNIWGGLGR